MSPAQKYYAADLESLGNNRRSSADRPCQNLEVDSWSTEEDASDVDDSVSQRNNSFHDEEDEDCQPNENYLDSGFEDSGNFQIGRSDGKSMEIRSRATEKKIQSILRPEPQVFKVYDKKEQKKRKHVVSKEPRKSVGFIFPEGVKIPEQVSAKRSRTPIRHLKKLKRKLRGEQEVPWRASAHTLGKSKPINPRVIKVDEGSKRGNPVVVIKSATLGDLKLKKIKPSELGEEDLDCSDYEQEDYEGNNSDFDDVDSKSEDGGDVDEKEVQGEEEEDEDLRITRRKALRHHLKSIQLTNPTQKKSSKRTPSFRTAGHGVGHARHHYPHAPSHHLHLPHFVPTTVEKDDVKSNSLNVPSIVISTPDNAPSIDHDSISIMNPDPESSDLMVKQKFRRSSSVSSIDRFLYSIGRLFESNAPDRPARPGKIIRTRYRVDHDEEALPSIE